MPGLSVNCTFLAYTASMASSDLIETINKESNMLKYLPGFIGAFAGFFTLQFIGWFDSWMLKFAAYIAVYLFVTITLDSALIRYKGK